MNGIAKWPAKCGKLALPISAKCLKLNGGEYENRTHVHGFAILITFLFSLGNSLKRAAWRLLRINRLQLACKTHPGFLLVPSRPGVEQ